MDYGSAKLHESRQNGSLVGNTLKARYWRILVAIEIGTLDPNCSVPVASVAGSLWSKCSK